PNQAGDVAPIRVIKGPKTMLDNPTGLALDLKNRELFVANFGNHMATVYPMNAEGNVAPLRVIRSAPPDAPSPMLGNPHSIRFDSKRKEILVANCVAHPQIVSFPRMAEGNPKPSKAIAGQNSRITRTIHDLAYDPIHDEIMIPQFYALAIMTFAGDADGDVAPKRIIMGDKTQLKNP